MRPSSAVAGEGGTAAHPAQQRARAMAKRAGNVSAWTGVLTGLPAKCRRRFSTCRSPIAVRVSTVALPTCGNSTAFSTPNHSALIFGSPSKTSRPAPAIFFSLRYLRSTGSSITEPRAMFTR